MAGYCTYDDLVKLIPEKEIIQLTDDDRAGVADQDVVTEAIDAEADIIDAYIGKVVALPVASAQVPPLLARLNARMAIYHLYDRVNRVPKNWEKNHEAAITMLKAIADGDVSLGIQPLPDAPADDGYADKSQFYARDKMFGPTDMDKY